MQFLDKIGIPVASSLPASGQEGDVIYFNGVFYGWTGSEWTSLGGESSIVIDGGSA